MSKAVLISIQPKWCEKIASGEKTVEVRRKRPKLETPFKCYIYCTLAGSNEFFHDTLNGDVAAWNRGKWGERKGNVIAEFICNGIKTITADDFIVREDALRAIEGSCLTIQEAKAYAGWKRGTPVWECKDLYGWHISDLVIYDTPKDLDWFRKPVSCWPEVGTEKCRGCHECELKRPPQSWCYVEVIE